MPVGTRSLLSNKEHLDHLLTDVDELCAALKSNIEMMEDTIVQGLISDILGKIEDVRAQYGLD